MSFFSSRFVIFGQSRSSHARRAFTLIELMVVIAIMVVMLSFLVPAIAPATGRSLEGAARQFTSDLENARQMAIAERTKTRVLIPVKSDPAFGADLARRSYAIVIANKTAATWKQRGKWNRLPVPGTFDSPLPTAEPAPSPQPWVNPSTEESILETRKDSVTSIDNSGNGSVAAKDFKGPYIEFRPNGSVSLNPADLAEVVVISDGIVNNSDDFVPKNKNLFYKITIDPLTGSARLK